MTNYFDYKISTIQKDDSIEAAVTTMKHFNIRHLPVISHGELVGMISDRNIQKAQELAKKTTKQFHVEDFMSSPAISLDRSASLLDVINIFLEKKIGSVVVTDAGKIVTIITVIDMVRILKRMLLSPDQSVNSNLEHHGLSSDLIQTLSSLAYF